MSNLTRLDRFVVSASCRSPGGIHLKHLQVKQNLGPKSMSLWMFVPPRSSRLPKMSSTFKADTKYICVAHGVDRRCSGTCERHLRLSKAADTSTIAGVGLDDHDSDMAEKLRGRGCGG